MGIRLRNALVVLQFVISIVCMTMTLLVCRQLSFMSQKNLGFRPADVFSVLAILIACIGLFGLSAYITEMRTKEIGVRKILGSTPSGVLALLSRDFAKLVILALAIAVPVSYLAMARWLRNFAFRTDISLGIFLVAGFAALLIEQAAISFQALKAAHTNPADTLRFE